MWTLESRNGKVCLAASMELQSEPILLTQFWYMNLDPDYFQDLIGKPVYVNVPTCCVSLHGQWYSYAPDRVSDFMEQKPIPKPRGKTWKNAVWEYGKWVKK